MKKIITLLTFLAMLLTSLPSSAQESKTIVYYFWKKPRCVSCVNLENYTKEAVEENFSKNVNEGKIEYKIVDFSLNENKHFGKKYGLYTKTVILSKVENGKEVKSKNLAQIWMKLRDKSAFKNYIKGEVESFIKD